MSARSEEIRFDARLAQADPAVPGLLTVLDGVLLDRWAASRGLGELRVDRLRYKPSTVLRAAVAPRGEGPWWLLTAHSPGSWRKVGKDLRAAAKTGGRVVVDESLRLVLTPAASDRALPQLRGLAPDTRTLAHNPARRAVLRDVRADRCRKVHADPHTARRNLRATQALQRHGIPVPDTELGGRHVVHSAWVEGRPVGPDDEPRVAELLTRLAQVDTTGLPVLAGRDLRAMVARAVAGTPDLDRGFTDRLWRTAGDWDRLAAGAAALDPRGFAHGDLSPDQLLRHRGGIVVLDVDRACRAPHGWDAASWTAAQAMGGTFSVVGETPPMLLAAAALVRAPEPFRRRRSGWAASTRRLLALAELAVGAS